MDVKRVLSIRNNTTYFLWSSSTRFHRSLSVSSSFFSLPLSITLGSSSASSPSSRDTLASKREISRYSRLSCAERTVPAVSDRGLPSNNAEEADEPSVERVKLDDNVDCAYDDVDEAET